MIKNENINLYVIATTPLNPSDLLTTKYNLYHTIYSQLDRSGY